MGVMSCSGARLSSEGLFCGAGFCGRAHTCPSRTINTTPRRCPATRTNGFRKWFLYLSPRPQPPLCCTTVPRKHRSAPRVSWAWMVHWVPLSCLRVTQAIKPDLVINAGTAGGFKKHDTAIGDVFVSTRVKNHDRRCVWRSIGTDEYLPLQPRSMNGGFIGALRCGVDPGIGVVEQGRSLDGREKHAKSKTAATTTHVFVIETPTSATTSTAPPKQSKQKSSPRHTACTKCGDPTISRPPPQRHAQHLPPLLPVVHD